MKYCPQCKEKKDILAFAKNRKRYDGLQNYCKVCKSKQDHGYYLLNKTKQRERVKLYLLKNRKKLWEYLSYHPCIDCGESNPIVLEFDHVIGIKKGAIAFLISSSKCSWDTIVKEINNCQVRCANCHRIKTAQQLGWYKFLVP